MRLSPTLHKYATMYNNQHTIIEDNIDMWYDCITDCYGWNAPFDMIAHYLDAITDEDTE